MESPDHERGSPTQYLEQMPTDPIRILVQTSTQLVPGGDYAERITNMQNLICQHHWNRDFDWEQDRWNVHGHEFAFPNRTCYFLIDHGDSDSCADLPVLWYRWDGESLFVKP
jgi:hypothetical protein